MTSTPARRQPPDPARSTCTDLLRRFRGGDRQAGDEIYRRNAPHLRRFFAARDVHGAEDRVHDVFVALLRAPQDFAERCGLRAYLLRIARHQLVDAYRRTARRRRNGVLSLAPADDDDAPRRLESRDRREVVRFGRRRLRWKDQQLLGLRYWRGLSGRQIAAALEINPHSARRRLHLARLRLGRELRRAERAG